MPEATDPFADLEGDVQRYEVPQPGGGTRVLQLEPLSDEIAPRLRLETPTDERSLTPEGAERLSFVYEPFFAQLGGDDGFVEDLRAWARHHLEDDDLEAIA